MRNEVLAKNIYRLRKSLEMNQQEVADKSKISRMAYSDIEKGKSTPRSETLHKIAAALKANISDLFIDLPELKSIRFRMDKPTEQKRKARELEISRVNIWLKNYNYLEKVLNKPTDYILKKLKTRDPIKMSARVRETLGIDMNSPINDISKVINQAGIKLHFSNIPMDGFFGLSVGDIDGGPAISVNVSNGISIERQIFTIAHELGHLLLHKDSYSGELFQDNKEEELEANNFASYFLMPDKQFKLILDSNKGLHWVDAILNVKKYFKVSYLTVIKRLIDLKIADRSIYSNFATEYKKLHRGNIKARMEPVALKEPDSPANGKLIEDRLYSMVRQGIEKNKITLSKGAEILNKKITDMRDLSQSWGELNWSQIK